MSVGKSLVWPNQFREFDYMRHDGVILDDIRDASQSPDMQPCDFSIWRLVERKMRRQERSWRNKHPRAEWKETLPEFKIRLRKTAFRLTPAEIDRCFAHMPKVLYAIDAANGGHAKCD